MAPRPTSLQEIALAAGPAINGFFQGFEASAETRAELLSRSRFLKEKGVRPGGISDVPTTLHVGRAAPAPGASQVLVIGNHSSGKSTFINRLLGLTIQDLGGLQDLQQSVAQRPISEQADPESTGNT